MKNALILHGTQGSSKGNWFPWLAGKLKNRGYKVWLPDLPHADNPSLKEYVDFILSNKDWEFNSESIIIGHSSGAIAILAILSQLPENIVLNKCILVSYFDKNSLGGKWEANNRLFDLNFDLEEIKNRSKKFILINSDNDDYVPAEDARKVAGKLGAEFMLKPGQGHFNLEFSDKYREFPFLLKLIAS